VTGVQPPLRVAVVGAATADESERATAFRLGTALGRRGAIVVCGGRGGVMEAAARGAAEAGAITLGVLPGDHASQANPWILVPLATGMGEARNALVVRAAEAVLSVGGRWGTLSEIALARQMGLDVGVLGTPPAEGLGLPAFEDADEAAEWALERAFSRRSNRSR
jgi:uncharacterized protein (TIGR00725 family)